MSFNNTPRRRSKTTEAIIRLTANPANRSKWIHSNTIREASGVQAVTISLNKLQEKKLLKRRVKWGYWEATGDKRNMGYLWQLAVPWEEFLDRYLAYLSKQNLDDDLGETEHKENDRVTKPKQRVPRVVGVMLTENRAKYSPSALAKIMNISAAGVTKQLNRAMASDLVVRVSQGVYALKDTP